MSFTPGHDTDVCACGAALQVCPACSEARCLSCDPYDPTDIECGEADLDYAEAFIEPGEVE